MKIYRLHCLCNVYVLFFIFCFRVVFLGAATVLIFFLNALVLYFCLEHVQRITFCRCFLIFNQAVFCIDDGVVLWLKIKNPTTTTNNFVALHYNSFYHNEALLTLNYLFFDRMTISPAALCETSHHQRLLLP